MIHHNVNALGSREAHESVAAAAHRLCSAPLLLRRRRTGSDPAACHAAGWCSLRASTICSASPAQHQHQPRHKHQVAAGALKFAAGASATATPSSSSPSTGPIDHAGPAEIRLLTPSCDPKVTAKVIDTLGCAFADDPLLPCLGVHPSRYNHFFKCAAVASQITQPERRSGHITTATLCSAATSLTQRHHVLSRSPRPLPPVPHAVRRIIWCFYLVKWPRDPVLYVADGGDAVALVAYGDKVEVRTSHTVNFIRRS
jgi:hypothetical protein